jgi:hypothetical protein
VFVISSWYCTRIWRSVLRVCRIICINIFERFYIPSRLQYAVSPTIGVLVKLFLKATISKPSKSQNWFCLEPEVF